MPKHRLSATVLRMIEKFLDYLCSERNYSPRTIESYRSDLEAFEKYFEMLDSQLSWETIDADVVRGWMEHMMDGGNTASTVNRRLSALRSLYRFGLIRNMVKRNPAHLIKGPKKTKLLPQFVRESDMDRLLDGEGMWNGTFEDMRARTILMMFYETGIRLAELVSLDDSAVDFVEAQIKVTGKRDKQRIVPFGPELENTLEAYIKERDAQVKNCCGALFVDDRGRRMTPVKVRTLVRDNLQKVTTMKKRSPHVLRHSFATAMLNNDAGLESVQKLLGHESLATTEIYTHTTFEQLKKVYNKAHPRA